MERIVSRDDIECPGDIIPYNCSILSNSESVHLTWNITLPGSLLNITYYGGLEFDNGSDLNSYISTSLTGFMSDEYIHSTLTIRVDPNIIPDTDQIMLNCSIGDLGFDISSVDINTSSK